MSMHHSQTFGGLIIGLLAILTVLVVPQAHAEMELYFIHNDHLGTPQVITDKDQTVVWEGRQKPFGETEVTTNTFDNDARFPGQYLDKESGLRYNYFRDYDPTIGRYIQSDPIGLQGGINTYAYVAGNPLLWLDPYGLEIVGEWVNRVYPQVYDAKVAWGDARRPDNWWKAWEHGLTLRAMEHRVDVQVGWNWLVECKDTCENDSWDLDGGDVSWFGVYVPVFTPVHPRVGRYTSVFNPAYNLLIKPAMSEALSKAGGSAELFFSRSATEICKQFPKGG